MFLKLTLTFVRKNTAQQHVVTLLQNDAKTMQVNENLYK